MNINESIVKNKIIIVLRGIYNETLIKTISAINESGIDLFEIAFDQSNRVTNQDVANNIRLVKEHFGDHIHIGAGTVLSKEQVKLAYKAGAEFIISPETNPAVIQMTKKLGMVSIPGAYTPTEINTAHKLGADYAKIFPCSEIKPSFFKAVSQPLNNVKLLAVGGITLENIKEYENAGAIGFGIANAIANPALIKEGKFKEISEIAKQFVEIVNK